MFIIYNIVIRIFYSGIYLVSFFNNKANQWIKGRKKTFSLLESFNSKAKKNIWFHCASLGEFYQILPLIKLLKTKETNILVSFFSPSGYNHAKSEYIDLKFYLPKDYKNHIKKAINIINPEQVIIVKNELWPVWINTLNKYNIITYLVCFIIHDSPNFVYRKFLTRLLPLFSKIHVQNSFTFNQLKILNQKNVILSGDTRYDYVIENEKNKKPLPIIQIFKNNQLIIISGSCWKEEEDLLIRFINTNKSKKVKYIFAPHNISKSHISKIEKKLKVNYCKFSNPKNIKTSKVLIIDNIGTLANCYAYTDIAVIGGGFKNKLHNILEPAVFKNSILFGNNYNKFPEAKLLIKNKGANSISSYKDFKTKINTLITQPELLAKSQINAYKFIIKIQKQQKKYFKLLKNIPPSCLKKNDKIALLAPSRSIEKNKLDYALNVINSWDLNPLYDTSIIEQKTEYLKKKDERIIAINQAIKNPEIKALFCVRGGYGSIQIIEKIDFNSLKKIPKWLIGFSDITILHLHLNTNLNIPSIHAPMPNNYINTPNKLLNNLYNIIIKNEFCSYTFKPHPLNIEGVAEGKLIGGNLSIISSLLGSKYLKNIEKCILFIEETDEFLYHIERMLYSLKLNDIFKKINGLIVGKFTDIQDNKDTPFKKTSYQIIQAITKTYNLPSAYNIPIGHIKNNHPIVLGINYKLEVNKRTCNLTPFKK